jgi:Regulator of ribonuclease activity B
MNESLIQDSLAGHAARNAALVSNISERGGDLNCNRLIDCFFFAPSEDAALSLSGALQSNGISGLSLQHSESKDDLTWSVQGSITASVVAFTSPDRTEQLIRLAASHDSIFDGWGTQL